MTKTTRFAPSPTGALHIGGVRTALFNYVYAKQNKGMFLIRIEDTDAERSTREHEENILKGLSDIGINPDKPPVRQSERSELYKHAAQILIDSGKAYYCNCSKERLDEMRSNQQSKGLKPQYDGKCRDLNLKADPTTVLRLKTPQDGELIFHDLVRGEVVFQNSELDDLILLRSDGSPTYHLCNVVDDFEQKNLWRLKSFINSGVRLAAGSDSPFGNLSPWFAMESAVNRPRGFENEALSPEEALSLYLKPPYNAGGASREIKEGATADLCLLDMPWSDARMNLNNIKPRATWIGGELVFNGVN